MSDSGTSVSIENQFTQSWIQALMKAADKPITRTIKPKLELMDRISLNRESEGRLEAAQELWDYATQHGLKEVLGILPVQSRNWEFPDEERFLYSRGTMEQLDTFETWSKHLGLQPGEFKLQSEVTNSDWTTLVRQEAVRRQKPFDSAAFGKENTLHPPCTAIWDGSQWTVRFDEIPWLEIKYDESPTIKRLKLEEIEETLRYAMSEADKSMQPRIKSPAGFLDAVRPWQDCLDQFDSLHSSVLNRQADYSVWFQRVWNCVWPVVYREQNVLRGCADIHVLRSEVAECLGSAPQLTVWMFVFAKLACQTQSGMGLGICADYVS